MKASLVVAAALVVGGVAWIGSGVLGRDATKQASLASDKTPVAAKLFKVAIAPVASEMHARRIVLSGRTEADKRVMAVARSSGVVTELRVRRGSVVRAGDVIATLSDEAAAANVLGAKARLEQRRSEAKARLRLIEIGSYPALNKPVVEAELRAAEAALAAAEVEQGKREVRAPIAGVVNEVPVEVGQAVQANMGAVNVAEIIGLDPMLAVVEIAERQLPGVSVGGRAEVRLVTGERTEGKVRFISKRASQGTRTYRVDVEMPNPTGSISDGVTAEVDLVLAAVPAAKVPRSALTFSSTGQLGVRHVLPDGVVAFAPVSVVEDKGVDLWLAGLPDGARTIVEGQDFVKEGERVEAVPARAAQG